MIKAVVLCLINAIKYMYPRMSGGNGKWSSDQRFLDHVNIDATKSINLVLTRAYVPLLLPYGVKMDTLFLKYAK